MGWIPAAASPPHASCASHQVQGLCQRMFCASPGPAGRFAHQSGRSAAARVETGERRAARWATRGAKVTRLLRACMFSCGGGVAESALAERTKSRKSELPSACAPTPAPRREAQTPYLTCLDLALSATPRPLKMHRNTTEGLIAYGRRTAAWLAAARSP